MQESKDEKEFRSELTKSVKESSAMFAESMQAMSSSMAALTSSMQKSFEHSARFSYTLPLVPQVHQGSNYIYQPHVGAASQHMFIPQSFNEEHNMMVRINSQIPTLNCRYLRTYS